MNNAPRILANRIFREASWFVLLFIGLYMTLALGAYNPKDPSWSNAVESGVVVTNLAGIFGAYFSDFTLYIFGMSAWWLVFLSIYSIFLIYPRIENEDYRTKHILPIHYLGFFLLILSSSSFEAGHIVSINASLPSEQGGMLGSTTIALLIENIGYIGSLVFLIVMFAIGFSLFTGWSWINIAEGIGNFLCNVASKLNNYYYDWQDRQQGKKFEKERSDFVHTERKKLAERSPLSILEAKTEIKESVRVVKEKQINLFGDGDSELPPLHLLDEPPLQKETQSSETIEFISRLIEKKLLDFGIEAKVTSAQPGPVITRYEFEPAPGVKGSQVTNLSKDLARALSVVSVRVVETIPGKTCMGLEIPNSHRQIVYLSEIMSSKNFADSSALLSLVLGKDISGKPEVADIARMPHLRTKAAAALTARYRSPVPSARAGSKSLALRRMNCLFITAGGRKVRVFELVGCCNNVPRARGPKLGKLTPPPSAAVTRRERIYGDILQKNRNHRIVTNTTLLQDFGLIFVIFTQKCIVNNICDTGARFFLPPGWSANKRVGKAAS